MRTITLLLLLLCLPVCAQQAQPGKQEALALKTTKAYGLKAQAKVKELFNYLELLTDPKLDAGMKAHVREQAEKLFNGEVRLANFFSKKTKPTALKDVLDMAVAQKGKYMFTITNFSLLPGGDIANSPEVWLLSYTVGFAHNDTVAIEQNFYIVQENKQFGTTTRQVTNTYLGSMQEGN